MSDRPVAGLGIIVWKDGKFLMFKRKGAHRPDTWAAPGGGLEYGESWEEGAEREVMEETGLSIKNIRPLAFTNDVFEDEHRHSVTIWLESDWAGGEAKIMEPHKHASLAWHTFKDLPSPLFEPSWQNLRKARPELFT